MGYLDALAALRKRKGLSQVKLAEQLGVEQPTIQRWESGKREPDLAALHQLAGALGVTAGALIDGHALSATGPTLYIKGDVAAGVWRAATEHPADEWQTFMGRAGVVANIEHRFGLRVIGDSMDQIYPEGTVLECVSVFGHVEPVPGKRVIIVRTDTSGLCEATVKELVEREGALWAIPRSSNPEHAPFRLDEPQAGIVSIRLAAVVIAAIIPE